MQSSTCNALKRLSRGSVSLHEDQLRHASLTGAIEKGIRHAQRAVDGKAPRPELTEHGKRGKKRDIIPRWSRSPSDGSGRRSNEGFDRNATRGVRPQNEVRSSRAPLSVPYTQADSEFLYGTFAVKAAIAARRRTLHKLYVYSREAQENFLDNDSDIELEAKKAKLDIRMVSGHAWLHLIEKMSQDRPHNGYLLEASPLPIKNMVGGLQSIPSSGFEKKKRYPFYLFLDLILDPGNLGAIIRSAYFFGVDGVIIPEHNTAPLTGVAIKASAGAAEYLPLLRIKNEIAFIQKSRANGWRFYGAVAMATDSNQSQVPTVPDGDDVAVADALGQHPSVLVLGGEAEGIRPRIARALDQSISIGTSASHPGIDSLNVSVAASLLIRDFLEPHSSGSHSSE